MAGPSADAVADRNGGAHRVCPVRRSCCAYAILVRLDSLGMRVPWDVHDLLVVQVVRRGTLLHLSVP